MNIMNKLPSFRPNMSKFLLAALAILAISADAKKKKPKKELGM